MIKAINLFKDYGQNRGIFNLNFAVKKGQVVGFLGPNGAGKTTTIRFLLGLISHKESQAFIKDFDCFTEQVSIQTFSGYLPGELTFIDDFRADEFLKFMAELKHVKDLSYAKELVKTFELNLDTPIRKMSKGMKQKLGLVIAFMAKPEVLILDEPSSGLDPLMQQKLIKLILHHKSLGATIFLSSHMFEEVEKTCDRVMIIKAGHIVADYLIDELKTKFSKHYMIEFETQEALKRFHEQYGGTIVHDHSIEIELNTTFKTFLNQLSQFEVKDISRKQQSIEDIFLTYYGEANDE